MTPLETLRVEVHRAAEAVFGKGAVPEDAGQVVVSKSYPPCSCPDEEPFYTVAVLGVWRKDRYWIDNSAENAIKRATDGVREMAGRST